MLLPLSAIIGVISIIMLCKSGKLIAASLYSVFLAVLLVFVFASVAPDDFSFLLSHIAGSGVAASFTASITLLLSCWSFLANITVIANTVIVIVLLVSAFIASLIIIKEFNVNKKKRRKSEQPDNDVAFCRDYIGRPVRRFLVFRRILN